MHIPSSPRQRQERALGEAARRMSHAETEGGTEESCGKGIGAFKQQSSPQMERASPTTLFQPATQGPDKLPTLVAHLFGSRFSLLTELKTLPKLPLTNRKCSFESVLCGKSEAGGGKEVTQGC